MHSRRRLHPVVITVVVTMLLAACTDGATSPMTTPPQSTTPQSTVPPMTTVDAESPEPEDPSGDEADVPEPVRDADFTAGPCPFDPSAGLDVACGTLVVPENRSRPDTADIRLAVAVVAAPEGASGVPIVYLAGGPGGSAIDDFIADPEGWDYPFLRTRDLVLVDQRGTGFSNPTLDCPEVADRPGAEGERACHERLTAEGVDVAAYTTAENAADVVALRVALGVERWNLLGVSYGTRLALDVMRQDPAGIGAVVLDSPFPPDVDVAVDEIYATTDALGALYADCERDAYCSENYPDLERVLLETVERLNQDETAEIFGDDLVIAIQNVFTDTELVPLVPWVVYEVANGNYAALDEIDTAGAASRTRRRADEDRSDSEGMYYSVMCNDEYAVDDYDRVEETILGTIPTELEGVLLQNAFELIQTCEYWSPQPVVDDSPVVSDVPTLILVGQYDIATPPSWARQTAASLGDSYLVEFPGAGHSVLSGIDCAIEITDRFLADPAVPPDDGCVAGIEWPFFE